MKIGLLDLKKTRGKVFPNLALMKIARFHRLNGDSVSWYDKRQKDWDKVYISKIFSYVPETEYNIQAKKIVRGCTGYYLNRTLPKAIENCLPDYSIYPDVDYAIGFLTRGCPNKCKYCVVPKKEGAVQPYSDWQRIKRADSKKIVFMDNTVLSCEFGVRQMRSMVGADIRIDFNQGLDCMRVDSFTARLLSRLKWIRYIRFACDKDYQMPALERAARLLEANGIKSRRLFVYVLGTDLQSTMNRVEFLRQLGAEPFVQPFVDITMGERNPDQPLRRYARYVNRKELFRSCTWKEFNRDQVKCKQRFYKEQIL